MALERSVKNLYDGQTMHCWTGLNTDDSLRSLCVPDPVLVPALVRSQFQCWSYGLLLCLAQFFLLLFLIMVQTSQHSRNSFPLLRHCSGEGRSLGARPGFIVF